MTEDDDALEMLRDALGRSFEDLLNESSDPLVVAEVVITLRELITGEAHTLRQLRQLRRARAILRSIREDPPERNLQ